MPHALDFDDLTGRRDHQACRDLLFPIDDLGGDELRDRRHSAAGHLLRVAHELVEMDARRSDEGPGSSPTLYHSFMLQPGKGMAGRHQTDAMKFRQLPLRGNRITRLEFARFDLLANRALNALIG